MKPSVYIDKDTDALLAGYIKKYGNRSKAIRVIVQRYFLAMSELKLKVDLETGEGLKGPVKKAGPDFAIDVVMMSPGYAADFLEALALCDHLEGLE